MIINGLRRWNETIDFYCHGSESDATKVRRYTAEEFYFWLERKVKAAKAQKAAMEKAKSKRK